MPTTPKIDELRGRLKADPKGRHFLPLAEELRKTGSLAEAEQALRDGLQHHPNYLSAWVSLGRVLKDGGRNAEAIDALQKALSLDGNNAVTARLLADTYLAMGEKVEAIKKYKLVNALLPDAEVQEQIEALERDLNAPPAPIAVAAPELQPDEPFAEDAALGAAATSEQPLDADDAPFDDAPFNEAPFGADDTSELATPQQRADAVESEQEQQGDESPFAAAATVENPFEESMDMAAQAAPDLATETGTADDATAAELADDPFTSSGDSSLFEDSPAAPRLATIEEPFGDVPVTEPQPMGREEDLFSDSAPAEPADPLSAAADDVPHGDAASARRDVVVSRLEGWLAKVKR